MIEIIQYIILIIVIISAGSIIIHSLINGISPMPSSPKMTRALLDVLQELDITGNVYELGSGWGTLALAVAGQFPGCMVKAWENSPVPWLFSTALKSITRKKNINFIRQDLFKAPLSEADVIITYLHPKAMEKLKLKFESELKKNTLIISNTFAVRGWKPEKIYQMKDIYRSRIYVYRAESR